MNRPLMFPLALKIFFSIPFSSDFTFSIEKFTKTFTNSRVMTGIVNTGGKLLKLFAVFTESSDQQSEPYTTAQKPSVKNQSISALYSLNKL
jgi:hypothetical protein